GLDANGWANSYYAAAVQAMSQDWTAFLFGSLDSANAITVDKPPASLWAMALSARILGFSTWSMLVPQALMGVGTVALLHAAVRRVAGPGAALVAGTVMALTPVAVLMFRFNNPDALLVLLMVGAAYATVRAVERAGTRWSVLAGVLIGFAFLAKMLQGFLVLPAFVLVYLVAAPTGLRRRLWQLLLAGVAVVVSAGWWIALVELWPADSRPYIGGSETNSALELALGYNGLGRILGGSGNMGGGIGGGGGFGGTVGLTRLFGSNFGGQISWLLPAALALLVVGLWLTRRAPRTDPLRASLLLWGGWTVVTGLVFSFMEGTIHEYYSVALAPGIAALVGVGGHALWQQRSTWRGRAALAVVTAGTAAWAWVLLGRSPDFLPWLRWVVVGLAVVAVAVLLLGRTGRRAGVVAVLVVALTGLAGPTAYAVQTAATAHTGSIVLAGPTVEGGTGFPGGGFPGGFPGGDLPAGGLPGDGTRPDGAPRGTAPTGTVPGGGAMRGGTGMGGGPGEAVESDPALVALLQDAGTRWAAATVGAQGAAGLELSSGTAVMAIGGFTGSDPAPTLTEFRGHVASGEIRYFIGSTDVGGRGNSEIAAWVAATYTATTVGGQTVYDLAG
ncbi:ArnT family glycosyltransferase, partial [Pseudonocardia abyssalis]